MMKCSNCGSTGENARFSTRAWIPTYVTLDGNGDVIDWGEEQYDKTQVATDPSKHTIVCMKCDSNKVVNTDWEEEEQ